MRAALMRSTVTVIFALVTLNVAPALRLVEQAHAQCTGLTGHGSTVVCSGSQTTTLGTSQDDVGLTVLDGADVTVGGSFAVFLGNSASIINNGTITGTEGLRANSITSLTNNGAINGRGSTGAAVHSLFSIGTLINSGAISGVHDGIYTEDLDVLVNSGTITGRDGVSANSITSLTNSGTISGVRDAIIQRGGATDTLLTLNAGSVLIGGVDLGGGTNTLNIGEGLSLNSEFESDSDFVLGTTGGQLIAIDTSGGLANQVIAAVDISAFANFDDALAALTAGIGQTVQGRQAALRSDPALGFASRFAAAEEPRLDAFSPFNDTPAVHPNRFWIEGFGAYRQDDGDRIGGEFDHRTGGLVAGVDVTVDALTSVGVMAGFAASTSENEIDTQKTDTTSFYAGLYASTQAMGLAWDASLTVGYTDYEQQRTTANNLVAGGLETASADFGGWFINPQLTATNSTPTGFTATPMGFGLASIEQSLTLSYAGLWLDGYTETGTTNPLTLNDRDVHVASARATITLPFERVEANGALTTLRLIGGLEARTQFGDDTVSGTLLGQAVSTTLGGDDQTLGGFLGLSGEYQTTIGLTAYANAEALIETDASWQLSATAGLRVAF